MEKWLDRVRPLARYDISIPSIWRKIDDQDEEPPGKRDETKKDNARDAVFKATAAKAKGDTKHNGRV